LERHLLEADCGNRAPVVSQDHEQLAPVAARIIVVNKWSVTKIAVWADTFRDCL
jgi:hypothetical protein